jgi:hypothetical protein
VTDEQSRRCGKCGLERPLGDFNRMGSGAQYWCRACFRDDFRARGERHRAQSGASRQRRVAAARRFITAYLAEHPCVDCGEGDARVLDFDHLADKAELVSALVARGAPRARIEAEIAKCEVRCANCHRRVTARRAGWSRLAGDIDDPRRGFSPPVRRNLQFVHAVLAAARCADCGEPDMLVLEFDHVGTKRGQISTMVWNVGLATLRSEVAECEIRCCNCHRRVTAKRREAARAGRSTVSGEPP